MYQNRLQSVLSILDDGLRLYRRYFSSFVLVGAVWIIPTALLIAGTVVAATWIDSNKMPLLIVAVLALLLPLTAYGFLILSQAAHEAAEGQGIHLGRVLRVQPLRLIGMLGYSIAYFVLIYIATSALSLICICPMYILVLLGLGLVGGVGGSGAMPELLMVVAFSLMFGTAYMAMLAVSGASMSSLVYALQPWATGRRGFGAAVQRSMELIVYRFGHNVLTWAAAAVVASGAGLAVALIVGLLIPLPAMSLFGEESRLTIAVSSAAWLLSLVLVLPPLPIWMALLYRRNTAAFYGAELERQVMEWRASA